MQVTKKVAEFISQTDFTKIPAEVLPAAKRAMLDAIGCALAGSQEPHGKMITEFTKQVGGKPVATVIQGDFKTSAPGAALANGTMAHALDYDDVDMAGPGHKSVCIVPGVLALGEQEKTSGKDALAAYIIGFEIASRVGVTMGREHWNEGWHSTATVGTMGSAAAASKILKLDSSKTAMALAIAASQASGLKQQFGTMMKPFHAGMASRAGVVSAMLARLGFTGDENILEGKAGYFKVLGKKDEKEIEGLPASLANPCFSILSPGVYFKPYACGAANHPTLDAVIRLAKAHNISPDEVASVEARIPHYVVLECVHHRPKTALEGKFSLEFTISMALLEGQVRLAQVTDEKVQDQRTKELIERIKIIDHEPNDPEPERVIFTLRDGRQLIEPLIDFRDPKNIALSNDELIAKYRDCARLSFSEKDIDRSIEMVQNLEHLTDIQQLTDLLGKCTYGK
ncbi:MmgE/PrpD family protein [Chloroflexota bacterium]